jgi:hypothetical protein
MGISNNSGRNKLENPAVSPVPIGHRYRRHEPEKTALYPIIERHLSTLTGELTLNHASLPAFVIIAKGRVRDISEKGLPTTGIFGFDGITANDD